MIGKTIQDSLTPGIMVRGEVVFPPKIRRDLKVEVGRAVWQIRGDQSVDPVNSYMSLFRFSAHMGRWELIAQQRPEQDYGIVPMGRPWDAEAYRDLEEDFLQIAEDFEAVIDANP